MAYRKRTGTRRRRRGFKNRVKNAVLSMAETKTHVREESVLRPLTLFNDFTSNAQTYDDTVNNALLRFNPLKDLVNNSDKNARIGNEIYLRGIRFEVTIDNSSPNSSIPIYVTTLVIMTYDSVDPLDYLFKDSISTRESYNYPLFVESQDDAKEVHLLPLNTKRMKVLHRSHERMSCAQKNYLSGPTFSQKIIYVPIRKKIKYQNETGENSTGQPQPTPSIYYICFATNPTQHVASSPTTVNDLFSSNVKSILYFKDV